MRTTTREPTDRRIVAAACAGALLLAGCGGTTVGAAQGRSESTGGSGSGTGGVLGVGGGASGGARSGNGGATMMGGGGLWDGGSVSAEAGPGAACTPNGEIPCILGKAEPCSMVTDWAGDEYCLVPPVRGFQIHVGPSDYSNPDEVAKFVLPPGGLPATDPRSTVLGSGTPDVDFCYYLKTSNDWSVYANHYYSRMRPGAVREVTFDLGSAVTDSAGPDGCSAKDQGTLGGGAQFMAGATRLVEDAALFGGAPEDAQVATVHAPHGQVSVNPHWVNITDKPLLMESWMNVVEGDYPPDPPLDRVGAIQWYGGVGMSIPPGQHLVVTAAADGSCSATQDVRILGIFGFTHSSTVRFAASLTRAADQTTTQIFEDYVWQDPTVFRFDSVTKNTPPDPNTKAPGSAYSGDLLIHAGDKATWECEIINNRSVTLTYSSKVYDGEMCNVFGMLAAPAPAQSQPWDCFSF